MTDKIPIEGAFSNEEIARGLRPENNARVGLSLTPKFMIPDHPGFELVVTPEGHELGGGRVAKLAYRKLWDQYEDDLSIELAKIKEYERWIKDANRRKMGKKHLKFHYKRAISLIDPRTAKGWNRWSEYILELFISSEKLHRVVWGSGNCGKSRVMAALLYTHWRVNPNERMTLIATKVVKDASARVFGYIKDIHLGAPPSPYHRLHLDDSKQNKGLYAMLYDESKGRYVRNDRGCILNVPIKVDSKNDTLGDNLIGAHPGDQLTIAFDEGQELPAKMLESRIFLNWYTNEGVNILAWGNPQVVEYNEPETHDLLFAMGSRNMSSIKVLKEKQKEAHKCGVWSWPDTMVLHLAMTDSPKDDPDECNYYIKQPDGTKSLRLHFLAGSQEVNKIAENVSEHSPEWFSQVLGFPYVNVSSTKNLGVVTPGMVREASKYPLLWSAPRLEYYMGVDPAASGHRDHASICVGRMGRMQDGRMGVDLMHGEGCRQIELLDKDADSAVDSEMYTDKIIAMMWELKDLYRIPLKNIAIETHGVGETLRYALQRYIEDAIKGHQEGGESLPSWAAEYQEGQRYYVVNPTSEATDRPLFKILGSMKPANEIVTNIATEYWVAVRCLVLTRQAFNIPERILQQFYNRHLEMSGTKAKYKLESKDSMRSRGVASPNDADALCNMVDLMRNRELTYKFYNSAKYQHKYGIEFTLQQRRDKTESAFGVLENMLGIEMGVQGGRKKKKRISGMDAV